ncbi:MAG: ABC transporter ATP-binding protein [Phycisphaeraceae bacterium]
MLRRLLPFWRSARRDTLVGTILLTLAAGIELLHPWPMKWLVDYVFGQQEAPAWLASLFPAFADRGAAGMIVSICITVLMLAVVHRTVHLISQYLLIRAGGKIVAQLRCATCEHLHRLSLTYHDKSKVGDSIYRAAYDTTAALSLVSQALAPALTGILVLTGILLVMSSIDWMLTLVTLAIAPCFFLLIRGFGKRIERCSKDYHERESALVSTLQESLSSIRAVQAFSREPQLNQTINEQTGRSLGALQRQVFVQLLFGSAVGLAMAVGTAGVVGVGAWRVVSGYLTIGDILVFLAYMGMLYQPMNAFSQCANVVHTARTQLGRVFEVLAIQPQVVDRPDAVTLPQVRGGIAFEDVAFEYEPGRPVLTDINLSVEPGQIVALVGRTGAGKTTFASLLLRFYDPIAGQVLLDGRDLRDLKLTWLREQISVVLQDTILFSATVAQNIAYARPSASPAEVEAAARRAQADEFIRDLPQGYETMLGERGVNLSGGQRQRLAIARAFLKNAPILVMDEPTSALDSHTERALVAAMRELMHGRTTFIIAHRLSTVRMADVIVVLDEGRIVEQGSHEDLLNSDSAYRRLHESQWSDAALTDDANVQPDVSLATGE